MTTLDKFTKAREALLAEREQLQSRLAQIEQALSLNGSHSPAPARPRRPVQQRNAMSLRAAVAQVTRAKALSKPEILAAVQKLGYRFTTSDPLNSLSALIYSKDSPVKNEGGKFRAR